jgi:nicotinamide-nucleotide amidase
VATYARRDAVDVRISAWARGGEAATDLADAAEAELLGHLGQHVWARGATTWDQALGEALDARGWTLGTVEYGTGGALIGLLGHLPSLRRSEAVSAPDGATVPDPMEAAEAARTAAGADVGLAVVAAGLLDDTDVVIAVATPDGGSVNHRVAFLRGRQGADRAAIAGAAVLLDLLRRPQ